MDIFTQKQLQNEKKRLTLKAGNLALKIKVKSFYVDQALKKYESLVTELESLQNQHTEAQRELKQLSKRRDDTVQKYKVSVDIVLSGMVQRSPERHIYLDAIHKEVCEHIGDYHTLSKRKVKELCQQLGYRVAIAGAARKNAVIF